MKYYKRKQVARFTLFGKDDTKYADNTSWELTAGTSLVKKLSFNLNELPHTEMSQNAMLVLESAFIKNRLFNTTENVYIGEVKIRCNNLNNTNCWDSSGKMMRPVLLWSGSHTNNTLWSNSSPDIFYNFPVSRNFLQNTTINLEIEIDTQLTTIQQTAFKDLALSFIVYDYDVEEINTMSEIDFKRLFAGRGNTR